MKRDFKKLLIATTLLYLTFIPICYGQPCSGRADTMNRPLMWFPKEEGQDRVKNFKLTKRAVLDFNSKVDQHGIVKLGNFIGLLKYLRNTFSNYKHLRIYIGMYSAEGSQGVPAGYGKQLTLIFSPADSNKRDLDTNLYYRIPPDIPFNEGNLQAFQINGAAKDLLVGNYFDKMPFSTIDHNNTTNVCRACTYKEHTDTKSILYDTDQLEELIQEQGYCHRDLTDTIDIHLTTDFLVFFTAQNINARNKANYRITLMFEFTTQGFLPYDLEDTYGFEGRKTRAINKPVDNGQLCPTVCQP